jgi:hypothetical protein
MAKMKVEGKDTKIESLDTSSSHIKTSYLDTSAKARACSYHAGEACKLAFARFAADAAGLQGNDRIAFLQLLEATPGWFGCGNNSACRQHYEKTKGGVDAIVRDYAGL